MWDSTRSIAPPWPARADGTGRRAAAASRRQPPGCRGGNHEIPASFFSVFLSRRADAPLRGPFSARESVAKALQRRGVDLRRGVPQSKISPDPSSGRLRKRRWTSALDRIEVRPGALDSPGLPARRKGSGGHRASVESNALDATRHDELPPHPSMVRSCGDEFGTTCVAERRDRVDRRRTLLRLGFEACATRVSGWTVENCEEAEPVLR